MTIDEAKEIIEVDRVTNSLKNVGIVNLLKLLYKHWDLIVTEAKEVLNEVDTRPS